MPRFYCPESLEIGLQLKLPESITRHVQVLRLTVSDSITLFNGQGGEFSASIIEMGKNLVMVEIKAFFARECELDHSLTLAQGLPEANKMDWIIEKAVELGATAFIPLAASRSVVKLSADRAEKKMLHWQGIMAAAAEQCGRNRLPHLAEPVNFTQWVAQTDLHKRLLLSPRATVSLSDWVRHQPAQALTIMVGPEGGFSAAEEELAIQRGAICVSMGPRVLRTETAGLAALAAIQSLWGEM